MWWDDEKAAERFDQRYDRKGDDECWPWLSYKRGKGYGVFYINKHARARGAHRLALERKLGRELGELHALHSCDNPGCVNPAHLRAGTGFDNMRDKVNRGRASNGNQRGERNGAAKLSAAQVAEIRRALEVGGTTGNELAKKYGVSPATISEIRNRRHWK